MAQARLVSARARDPRRRRRQPWVPSRDGGEAVVRVRAAGAGAGAGKEFPATATDPRARARATLPAYLPSPSRYAPRARLRDRDAEVWQVPLSVKIAPPRAVTRARSPGSAPISRDDAVPTYSCIGRRVSALGGARRVRWTAETARRARDRGRPLEEKKRRIAPSPGGGLRRAGSAGHGCAPVAARGGDTYGNMREGRGGADSAGAARSARSQMRSK